ncbi:MAG: ABC transporter permease [Bacteroidota bacterium]
MLLNYLKVALRSFAANKLYSFINIFALSVAMACGILAYVNFDFARGQDRFHRNLSELFVLRSVTAVDRGQNHIGITPYPLGSELMRDVPQIERMTRVVFAWVPVRVGEQTFNIQTYYVEPDFLRMFTFPQISGNANTLDDKSRIILTRKTAEKYFGGEDPIGKVMTLQSGGEASGDFVVAAVLEDIPSNSSLQFGALLPMASLPRASQLNENWNTWSHETIVQVKDPAIVEQIESRLAGYVETRNAMSPDLPLSQIYLTPMEEVAALSRNLTNDIFKEGMHPAAIFGPTITSILLLITACFNFMNTSLAFSAVRLKEVGVRKVLGSSRYQLVVQFIGENLILCSLALLIAVGLAEVFVPAYSNLWVDWELTLSYSDNMGLFVFLVVMLVGMSIVSGAYPSIYVSRFTPVSILTGRQRFSGNHWLMQGILTFQFSLSALTILAGIVFTSNASFLENINLGFDTKQTIAIPLQGSGAFETLRNAAGQHPDVQEVEGVRHLIGYNQSTLTARSGPTERRVAVLQGGFDQLSVMNLKLAQGRDFDRKLRSDRDGSVIVSRKFAREFQWDQPVGQRVTIDSSSYTVIGVVEDFYNRSVWNPVQPSAFLVAEPENFRYLVVRAELANLQRVNDFLRETWQQRVPNVPYEGFYGSELVANAVSVSSSIRLVFLYVSGVAIAIAAMGLFALSSLIIVKRTKEIGIRKVLGAPVLHILNLLNRRIALVLLVSGLLAAVSGSFLIGIFLDSLYAYHVEMQFWHFALAGAIVVLIGLITVSSQVYRVATSNPVESLKYE